MQKPYPCKAADPLKSSTETSHESGPRGNAYALKTALLTLKHTAIESQVFLKQEC